MRRRIGAEQDPNAAANTKQGRVLGRQGIGRGELRAENPPPTASPLTPPKGESDPGPKTPISPETRRPTGRHHHAEAGRGTENPPTNGLAVDSPQKGE